MREETIVYVADMEQEIKNIRRSTFKVNVRSSEWVEGLNYEVIVLTMIVKVQSRLGVVRDREGFRCWLKRGGFTNTPKTG